MTDRPVQSRRDRGITALVEGFFANVWFGWGHADASATLSVWLNIGGGLAIFLAVVGAIIGFRSPASTSAVRGRAAARRYGIIVGIEFGVAGIGAGILGGLGQVDAIPIWICAVVGVHFFALASLLRDRLLIPLGALMCAVAVAAAVLALTTDIAPSSVTGVGAGVLLLVFGVLTLAGIRSAPADR